MSESDPPPQPRRSFTGRFVVLLMTIGLLATALLYQHQWLQTSVARVGNHDITREELILELRHLLWRQQLKWENLTPEQQQQQRELAIQKLVDSHLLEQASSVAKLNESAIQREVERRLQQSIRQFENIDAWKARASAQGIDEVLLREKLLRETRITFFLEKNLSSISVQETDIRQWYEANRSSCRIPQRAHASHLFLTIHDAEKSNREKEIHSYHQQIVNGQSSLAELARKHSEDPRSKSNGGDLGWFSIDRVPEDFATQVFSLSPNQLSQPFLTNLGWHVVLLHEKQPSRPATYEECRNDIYAQLEEARRTETLQTITQSLRETQSVVIHSKILAALEPPSS